jgi:genome maintenance exonuclease 1
MKIFTHEPIQLAELDSVTLPSGQRFYTTPDGKRYPSITTVLSQHTQAGIDDWKQRVGEDEARKIGKLAAAQGTRFHNITESYLNNSLDQNTISMFDKELFLAAKPHLNNIDNIIAQEVSLYSHFLRLAGRVDCIASFKGRRSIIDFKTSKREKPKEYIEHYFMQAAGYAVMFEEITGIPIAKLVIIIAVEGGECQVFEEKRDNYVARLIEYRDLYEENNK